MRLFCEYTMHTGVVQNDRDRYFFIKIQMLVSSQNMNQFDEPGSLVHYKIFCYKLES